jgi:glutathione peroxidase
MFEKIAVTGDEKHPLYAALTSAKPDTDNDASPFRERLKGFGMTPNEAPEILWNFEKFLIARDGAVVGRFAPTTAPDDAEMLAAIEAQLAA